jgi:cytochrome b
MAAPPAPGPVPADRACTRDPVHGRMNAVPAHMAYAVTSKLVYRASSGFCAAWNTPWSTAAASTTSAEAPNPSPCDAAMSAVPASAIALPAHHRRPARSPRNATASRLE